MDKGRALREEKCKDKELLGEVTFRDMLKSTPREVSSCGMGASTNTNEIGRQGSQAGKTAYSTGEECLDSLDLKTTRHGILILNIVRSVYKCQDVDILRVGYLVLLLII